MPVWTQVVTALAALCSFVLVDKYLRRRFVESGVPTEAQLIAFDAFWGANQRFIYAAVPVVIVLVGSLIASNAGVSLPGWLMTVVLFMGVGAMLLTIGVGRKQKRFVETLANSDESVQNTGEADESLSDPAR